MLFKYAKGATPLSPDEIHNLIPSHLTTQKQLDEWEQYNLCRLPIGRLIGKEQTYCQLFLLRRCIRKCLIKLGFGQDHLERGKLIWV